MKNFFLIPLFIIIGIVFVGVKACNAQATAQDSIEYLQDVVESQKAYIAFLSADKSSISTKPREKTKYKPRHSIMIDLSHLGNLFYEEIDSEKAFNQMRFGIGYSMKLNKHLNWYGRFSTDIKTFQYISLTWGYQFYF